MKKHFFFITLILCMAFTLFGISLNNTAKATSQAENHTESPEELYILSDYHGRIALFKAGNGTPIKVFDVFTSSLPQKDVDLIKSGIALKYEDINNTVEDFLS